MELFDVSLLAAPAGVVIAIVAAIRFRSGWALDGSPRGLVGGFLGRVAWGGSQPSRWASSSAASSRGTTGSPGSRPSAFWSGRCWA